jgi:hypothetical protein
LPKAPTEPAITRDLCLVGYAGLISGRAEDLRMSALALSRHSRQWAVLDRLSGAITTEDSRPAAAFAEPPGINLMHLNADTAFFDYLFLRERGIERGYTIGYWAWELAKFPEEWRYSFAFVQEVWAASRFAYEAIAPATTKPVFLMPPAVAIPAPEPGLKRADFGLPDDKFIFYFSFDFRSYTVPQEPARRDRRVSPRLPARRCSGLPGAQDDRLQLEIRGARCAERDSSRGPADPGHRSGIRPAPRGRAGGVGGLFRIPAPLGGLRPRPCRGNAARQTGHHDRLFRHP